MELREGKGQGLRRGGSRTFCFDVDGEEEGDGSKLFRLMRELKAVGHKIVVHTSADEEKLRRLAFVDEVVRGNPEADVFVGYSRDGDVEKLVGWKLREAEGGVGRGAEGGGARARGPEDLKLPRSFHVPRR